MAQQIYVRFAKGFTNDARFASFDRSFAAQDGSRPASEARECLIMDRYLLVRTVLSMILGLGVAHLLKGIAQQIENPKKRPPYVPHLLWIAYVFLFIVSFWWWEFALARISDWNFAYYSLLVAYVTVIYLICYLLVPSSIEEFEHISEYFYARRNWFFGLMIACFVTDIGDTLIKGSDYWQSFRGEILIRNLMHIAAFAFAIYTRNEKYHYALPIIALTVQIAWIIRHYYYLA